MSNDAGEYIDPLADDSTDDEEALITITTGIFQVVEASVHAFEAEAAAQSAATSSRRRGSNRRQVIHRDYVSGAERLYQDYFAPEPIYPEHLFRRRFRMSRRLFNRIVEGVQEVDTYFRIGVDATGRTSLTPHQKCTAAVRQLAYGCAADLFDEHLRIGESTGIKCLRRFCAAVIKRFSGEFLRKPTTADTQRLLRMHEEKHGFPGMLGSLDCMHWGWKNCPKAHAAAYTRGDKGYPTLILEAVASQDLWIWHAFFGVAGSNNDINVLNASPLFEDTDLGTAPAVDFVINGHRYTQGYYLVDGIYPDWPVFVKSIPAGVEPDRLRFNKIQEAARKDIERAFGVLQARWHIVRGPSRQWHQENLSDIMMACIVMHNMIIGDEGPAATTFVGDDPPQPEGSEPFSAQQSLHRDFGRFLHRVTETRDVRRAHKLQADLVHHVYSRFGPLPQPPQ